MPVGRRFVPCARPQKIGPNLCPCPSAMACISWCRGTGCCVCLSREQRGLVSVNALVWRHSHCQADQGVVGVRNPAQKGRPCGPVLCRHVPEGHLLVLIHPFCLSVGLRMESRGQTGGRPQMPAEPSLKALRRMKGPYVTPHSPVGREAGRRAGSQVGQSPLPMAA